LYHIQTDISIIEPTYSYLDATFGELLEFLGISLILFPRLLVHLCTPLVHFFLGLKVYGIAIVAFLQGCLFPYTRVTITWQYGVIPIQLRQIVLVETI
jgi:hypothetical protein